MGSQGAKRRRRVIRAIIRKTARIREDNKSFHTPVEERKKKGGKSS